MRVFAATTRERLLAGREEFAAGAPFPHLVLDDFLLPEAAAALEAAFAGARGEWITWHHVNERKRGFNDVQGLPDDARAVVDELQSPSFVGALERLTGVSALLADPDLDGAGLHETPPGGHLNVHTDFLSHTRRRCWSRQLNLLLFLNRDWPEEYGGALELWSPDVQRCVRRIAPLFNRCVVFRTTGQSFHGVPEGVHCPAGRTRKSLALYYFRDEGHISPLAPTNYFPRPSDDWGRRLLIRADRWALYAYSLLKRYTPIDDKVVGRLLRRLSRR
ncbi:MAG: 2OG-Fe(II) oxygenase [Candidatus Sumerlaeia bacterium]|nr:2OG-Fe(II) oxygenase [Candidatus Sumerlaeia bacterium]